MTSTVPTSRPNRYPRRAVTALLLSMVTLGNCGSPSPSELPADALPVYTDEAAALFDDSLDPAIFDGIASARPAAARDFTQLVQHADHVTRVRLTTVTRSRGGGRVRYHMVLQPQGSPIVGPKPDVPVEVSVEAASPAASLLRSLDSEAVGKEMIIFLKRYRSNDESVWHFRGVTDSEDTLGWIRSVQ